MERKSEGLYTADFSAVLRDIFQQTQTEIDYARNRGIASHVKPSPMVNGEQSHNLPVNDPDYSYQDEPLWDPALSYISDILAEDEDVGVTHYLYNNPTYPNKKGFISSCKDHLCEKMENGNIQEIQYQDFEKKYYSPNSHQNRKSYKDILVKDLEKLPSRRGNRWRMKPHEGEHSKHDRHDHPPQIQHEHSPQNQNDPPHDQHHLDHLHDEQLDHLENQIGHHPLSHYQPQLGHQQHQFRHHQLGNSKHQIGHQQHQIGHQHHGNQQPHYQHHDQQHDQRPPDHQHNQQHNHQNNQQHNQHLYDQKYNQQEDQQPSDKRENMQLHRGHRQHDQQQERRGQQ